MHHPGEPLRLQGEHGVLHQRRVVVHDGMPVGRLVAGRGQGLEGEGIDLRGRRLLLNEAAEHAGLRRGEVEHVGDIHHPARLPQQARSPASRGWRSAPFVGLAEPDRAGGRAACAASSARSAAAVASATSSSISGATVEGPPRCTQTTPSIGSGAKVGVDPPVLRSGDLDTPQDLLHQQRTEQAGQSATTPRRGFGIAVDAGAERLEGAADRHRVDHRHDP